MLILSLVLSLVLLLKSNFIVDIKFITSVKKKLHGSYCFLFILRVRLSLFNAVPFPTVNGPLCRIFNVKGGIYIILY